MSEFFSTRQIAQMAGVPVSRLRYALANNLLAPPMVLPGGDFGWTAADVPRIKAAMSMVRCRKVAK